MTANMIDNRMTVGEYYEETERDRVLASCTAEDYADYVYDVGHVRAVISDWLGCIITEPAAYEVWDHTDDAHLCSLCQRWVLRHQREGFEDWRMAQWLPVLNEV